MAVEDYAKLKKMVAKNRSDNVATWKEIQKNIKESLKQIETLESFFSDASTTFQVNTKMAGTKLDDWARVADQIIAKQTELKAAVKKKDKAAIKDLEKDIRDLDKLAVAHQTQVSKTIDATNELKANVLERVDQLSGVTG
ncbi:MAG: hypothetical protein AAGC57_10165 [Pseudomonadota bacterium]